MNKIVGSSQELESMTDESSIGEYGSKLLNNISTPRSNTLCQISTPKASAFGSKGATAKQTPTLNEFVQFDNILQ